MAFLIRAVTVGLGAAWRWLLLWLLWLSAAAHLVDPGSGL